MILHEVMRELKRKNLEGVILKLNFEKAYHRDKWSFLEQVMIKKNFPRTWTDWTLNTVKGGKLTININGQMDKYLKPKGATRRSFLPSSLYPSGRHTTFCNTPA